MNKKVQGLIMAIVGFIMILINAVGYIFNLEVKSSALTILGIIFVVIGMKMQKE